MITLFRFRLLAGALALLLLLSACAAQPAQPTSQPVHYTLTPAQAALPPAPLRAILVQAVTVQFGEGSPLPVSVFVSGVWPDLCAQLAEVHQAFNGSAIEIRLLATALNETCPPDLLGLPFSIAIPFNMVEMPEGDYTVTVNGVSTAFGWGTVAVQPLDDSTSAPPALSFEAAVYRDETAGFEFDYPASWTVDKNSQGGDRGSTSQLTSWAHAPGDISAETPSGGARMDVTVYSWEPQNDLDAFVEVRKQAWDASGIRTQSQETWGSANGQLFMLFQVLSADQQEPALFLFTAVGDRYLSLSGSGDIKLLEEIFRTIRLD